MPTGPASPSALYLLDQCGADLATARGQLSWDFYHLKSTRTGILDHILDLYGARLAQGPIPVRDWFATEYDDVAVRDSFAARRRA